MFAWDAINVNRHAATLKFLQNLRLGLPNGLCQRTFLLNLPVTLIQSRILLIGTLESGIRNGLGGFSPNEQSGRTLCRQGWELRGPGLLGYGRNVRNPPGSSFITEVRENYNVCNRSGWE